MKLLKRQHWVLINLDFSVDLSPIKYTLIWTQLDLGAPQVNDLCIIHRLVITNTITIRFHFGWTMGIFTIQVTRYYYWLACHNLKLFSIRQNLEIVIHVDISRDRPTYTALYNSTLQYLAQCTPMWYIIHSGEFSIALYVGWQWFIFRIWSHHCSKNQFLAVKLVYEWLFTGLLDWHNSNHNIDPYKNL